MGVGKWLDVAKGFIKINGKPRNVLDNQFQKNSLNKQFTFYKNTKRLSQKSGYIRVATKTPKLQNPQKYKLQSITF
jgi:hypothetical protein